MQKITIEGFQLSPQQKRLWTLGDQEGRRFRAQCAVLIEGELDREVLESALAQVVQRNEILRTSFQRLSGMDLPLQVVEQDSRVLIDESPADDAWNEALCNVHPDGPLQVWLSRLRDGEHLLTLSLPAMCSDAQGLRNLVAEISSCYDAIISGESTTEGPLQYVDLSDWQNELLEAETAEPGRAYWSRQDLTGVQTLKLPYQHEATETDGTPRFVSLRIHADVVRGMEEICSKYESSASTFLLTCWQALLWRLTGQSLLTVGAGVEGRNYPGLESALGLFAKYLPVSSQLESSLTFRELLASVGKTVSEEAEYQEYFVWENRGEDGVDAGFFPFCFDYEERGESYGTRGVKFSIQRQYVCTERYHVRLLCVRSGAQLAAEFYYDDGLYCEEDIARLAEEFEQLVGSVVADERGQLGELEMVGAAEREQLLRVWNETRQAGPAEQSILEVFAQQVAARGAEPAVRCGESALSYAELDQRSNRLARRLQEHGIGAEVAVGLCVERSLEMVVGLLGIMKAGGVYVPLEPSYPAERLRFMVEESGAGVVLTQEHLRAQLEWVSVPLISVAEESDTDTDRVVSGISGANLAYLIYTSGSSGQPKGVGVTHGNLVHSTWARQVYYGAAPERFLLLSSFAFDSSVAGIFWTLSGGGTLVLPAEGEQRDVRRLVQLIAQERVTHLLGLPAVAGLLLEAGEGIELDSLQVVIVAGEACRAELVQRHQERLPRTALYNEYGPTEATVWSSVYQCLGRGEENRETGGEMGAVVPIGRPIANAQLYILDEGLRPVALGMAGELYIGGAGITRGYLQRAELTAERYVPHGYSSEPGARLYKTGDLARYRRDGNVEFLGRADWQVKVRGYRIELGEIEAVLNGHEAVREAVVVAREEEVGGAGQESGARLGAGLAGSARLVAYVGLDQERARTACRLLRREREAVKGTLPSYELPNGLTIMRHNRNEADYLYQEIFEEQEYVWPQLRLSPEACVFDVGANIGLFSLWVGQQCKGARLYAFEPMPEIFKVLRANAELYGLQARLFECGLADVSGTGQFSYYPHLSLMSGRYADAGEAQAVVQSYEAKRMTEAAGAEARAELPDSGEWAELLAERLASEEVECRVRTLSEVMRAEGVEWIDLLKVDVEKSELEVLQGVAAADWEKIGQVVVEVEDREGRLKEVEELLETAGYEVTVAQDKGLRETKLYKVYAVRTSGISVNAISGISGVEWTREVPSSWRSPAQLRDELRQRLREQLPEHMMPDAIVLLEEFPRTQNGKVDRKALPAPEREGASAEVSLPRTPIEEVLAGIWAEVLGVTEVSVTANFFELGGHSLLATQVMSRVSKAFQIELPVRSLFATPTVRGLATTVEEKLTARHDLITPPLNRVSRDRELPLSFAQQRLWFADQLTPGNSIYNVSTAVRLSGPLDILALERTLSEVTRRHEVLRTTYPAKQGQPTQVIAPATTIKLEVIDLSDLETEEAESRAHTLARAEATRPFDLARGPLLRASLVRLGPEDHVALFTMHHVVSDAWSLGLLIKEVSLLYEVYSRGEESPLAELTIQYADYAVWQREWLQDEALEEQLKYWRKQLQDAPQLLKLPIDKKRSEVRTFHGAHYPFSLSPELSEEIRALSRREGSTVFMTLLAVFQTLLHYYSNQNDIVVGVDIANRNRVEVEELIGFFINILVLSTKFSGNPTFRELLSVVRETTLGAYAHQDLPFERIVEEMRPDRSLGGMPLVQVMFSFQNDPQAELKVSTLTLSPFESNSSTAKRELTLFMRETENGLAGAWNYQTELFKPGTITRMAKHFEIIVREVVAKPDLRVADVLKILAEAQKDERRDSRLKQFMTLAPKPLSLSQVSAIKSDHLTPGETMPLVIRPALDDVDLAVWARSHRKFIEEKLLAHGAILFRGFNTQAASDFEQVAASICSELFAEYGDLPREGMGGKVYGSTPYPPDQAILFHNESSHLHRWPMKIWFFCMQAAQTGGETPIVDCRKIYEALNPKLRERFEQKKLMYVRNYVDGLDVSWQEFFRTNARSEVEDYCRKASIAIEWKGSNGLRTRQVCDAVLNHPKTGEKVFFNQLQAHHVSCLEPATRASLLSLLKEEDLPRNVYYGDGSRIEDAVVDEIREVYQRLAVNFPWERKDILMLDNMLIAHGRNPYVGDRKICVAMGEMISK